jgi:hypothetical protein
MPMEAMRVIEETPERVGKVFIVEGADCRRCLVCDDLFTREASKRHSAVICFPPDLLPPRRRGA